MSDSADTNVMDKDSLTCVSQEGEITIRENRASEVAKSAHNLNGTSNENITSNANPEEQNSNISSNQLQDVLMTAMQATQSESAKRTAAVPEESKKQTALFQAESVKLTSAVESLRSEINKENEMLAESLTAEFEAAHDKIREDFKIKLNSEILIVKERTDNVRKDNENEVSTLYASVSERINAHVTQTGKQTDVHGQEVLNASRSLPASITDHKEQTDEISKLIATLGELQNKLAAANSNNPQSAGSGNVTVRVNTADQQTGTDHGVETNAIPNESGINVCSNFACHDSSSVVGQTASSDVYKNVNATSDVQGRRVGLRELTLPPYSGGTKQVPLHFIRDPDLYFKLKQTLDHLKLPLTFRAVQEPTAKRWLSSTYGKLNSCAELKTGFADLLWNPNRQAGIRSQIY
jgi:hypothetical protein